MFLGRTMVAKVLTTSIWLMGAIFFVGLLLFAAISVQGLYCLNFNCTYQKIEFETNTEKSKYHFHEKYFYEELNSKSAYVNQKYFLFFEETKTKYLFTKLNIHNFDVEVDKWESDSTLIVKRKNDRLFSKNNRVEYFEMYLPQWFEARQHFATVYFLKPDTKEKNGWVDVYHQPGSTDVYLIKEII